MWFLYLVAALPATAKSCSPAGSASTAGIWQLRHILYSLSSDSSVCHWGSSHGQHSTAIHLGQDPADHHKANGMGKTTILNLLPLSPVCQPPASNFKASM